jgi:thiol:disulfide interchange protein
MTDAIGLLVLALLIAPIALVVPESQVPLPMWVFAYIMLAVIGAFMWHSEKSPQEPLGWLLMIVGLLVLGGLWFGVDVLIGLHNHPDLPFFEAAKESKGPFGFVLSAVIIPGITLIAASGAARSLYVARRK